MQIFQKINVMDVSAVAYALMYSLGRVQLEYKGKPTGIIYGFLNQLRFFKERLNPDVTVFACDCARKTSLRHAMFDGYKDRNDKDPETMAMLEITSPQIKVLKKNILPYLGFKNIIEVDGYEADDHMHMIATGYGTQNVTMITRDKDMYQSLSENVRIFEPTFKRFFTMEDLKEIWGCTPTEWGMAKAIAGCSTDTVPGIPRVAEKTAIKYLHGELKPTTKTYQDITSIQGQDIIKRNKRLVVLPFKDCPPITIKPTEFSKEKLRKVAEYYGFNSIIDDYKNWNLK